MERTEERDIVIVGGGICGLATALALHRKGISSLVLERSDTLRATGAAMTIRTNGWHALDHLGVGSLLRDSAVPIEGFGNVDLSKGTQPTKSPISNGETRCIRRSDLITALAHDLPPGTIRFKSHVYSVTSDPVSSHAILHLQGGSIIKAKVLVGCDGVNSVVLDYLEMKPTRVSAASAVRGFTNYPRGHGFENLFILARRGQVLLGRVPVNNSLVYWFITRLWTPEDLEIAKDQELIKNSSLKTVENFPEEMRDMIKSSDARSLSCMRFNYRAPWDLMVGSYRKGTATVAGDALHAMTPFIGQGGSASLEDAVVLARCLAHKISQIGSDGCREDMLRKHEEALQEYITARRMRLVRLTAQSYLMNKLAETSSSFVKIVCVVLMAVFFRDSTAHTKYDCRHP